MSKFPLCDTNIKHCGGSPHYGATPATHLNKPHHQKSLVLQPKGAKTNDQAWKNILGCFCLYVYNDLFLSKVQQKFEFFIKGLRLIELMRQ